MRMTLADVAYDRSQPGRSVGLFLTDRCPVGCAHCSVDSRHDSPTVSDYRLLSETIATLCARPNLRSVGITGGEPFIEKRGLTHAVNELSRAGKSIVLFTSGVWARSDSVPAWIKSTLRKVACVFLSTDAYHAASVDDEMFIRAIRTIADENVWLIIQVLEENVDSASLLLDRALGSEWSRQAELSRITPLPYGRGATLFSFDELWPVGAFGQCTLASTPLIRYDGIVTACCNEEVIMGKGSERLRRRCSSAEEIENAVDHYISDPLLLVLSSVGAGPIISHPRYNHLRDQSFRSICHLCWAMQDVTPSVDRDHVMSVTALLGKMESRS